jgi:hypothetical protein
LQSLVVGISTEFPNVGNQALRLTLLVLSTHNTVEAQFGDLYESTQFGRCPTIVMKHLEVVNIYRVPVEERQGTEAKNSIDGGRTEENYSQAFMKSCEEKLQFFTHDSKSARSFFPKFS